MLLRIFISCYHGMDLGVKPQLEQGLAGSTKDPRKIHVPDSLTNSADALSFLIAHNSCFLWPSCRFYLSSCLSCLILVVLFFHAIFSSATLHRDGSGDWND
jgi:hypothetical protein